MHIRPATISDCADLVILDDIAGRGLASYLWQCAVAEGEGDNALEIGHERYLNTDKVGNWTDATVAEVNGAIAGAAVGFLMPSDVVFPSADNAIVASLHRLIQRAAGSWYIDILAVYSRVGRQGIARALLADQIARAGTHAVCVVTNNDNTQALALYRGAGFFDKGRQAFVGFNDHHTTEHWLMLRREP